MLDEKKILEYLIGDKSTIGKKKLSERINELVASQQMDLRDPQTITIVSATRRHTLEVLREEIEELVKQNCELARTLNNNNKVVEGWIGKYEAGYAEAMSAAERAQGEMQSLVSCCATDIQTARALLPAMNAAVRAMEAALRRYEALKRFPNVAAKNRNRSGVKWVCSECGTEMGKANLYGLAKGDWSRLPVYCPGCGAKTPYGEPFDDSECVQNVNYTEMS